MGKLVLTNVRLFANACDLTAMNNRAELKAEVESKDATTYGSVGWREFLGALGAGSIDAEGFWEALDLTKVDDALWAALGGVGPWSICPTGAAVGAVAHVATALEASYQAFGTVGDIAPWKASAMASGPIAEGQVLNAPGTALTVTGTGTPVQMTAVSASQRLFANLHVLSVAGTGSPTLTARIESAPTIGFAAPTTRATFAAATAVGGQSVRANGPITDAFWRAAWTISGTSPSFLALVTAGIK